MPNAACVRWHSRVRSLRAGASEVEDALPCRLHVVDEVKPVLESHRYRMPAGHTRDIREYFMHAAGVPEVPVVLETHGRHLFDAELREDSVIRGILDVVGESEA